MLGVSDGLSDDLAGVIDALDKAQAEVAGGDVADGGNDDQSDEAADQGPILEQDHVTQTAHHAQTGTLSDGAHDQTGGQINTCQLTFIGQCKNCTKGETQ